VDLRRITHPYYCCRREVIQKALKNIQGFVVDIGCASGHITKLASNYAAFAVGMDVNLPALKEAESSSNVDFMMADANARLLPYRDAVFDYVLCFDVIEHLQNDKQFLKEIKRILKQNGVLYLTTLNRNRLHTLIRKLIGKPRHYPHKIAGGYHIREYTKDEFRDLLISQGFKVDELRGFFLGITLRHGHRSIGFARSPKFLEKYCFGLFAKSYK